MEIALNAAAPQATAQRRIAALWAAMTAIYGHRWTSSYGHDADLAAPAPRQWEQALGMVPGQGIADAIAACRMGTATTDGWPPTLPEFRALALGIPPLALVAAELTKPAAPRKRFIALVWQHLDRWTFTRADQRQAEHLLRTAYLKARDHILEGGDLPPEPAGEIDAPKEEEIVLDEEAARRHMRAIDAMLGSPVDLDEDTAAHEQEAQA